jgi:hypothetical protein
MMANIVGQHPIKQIATKHSSWNIITTLSGTNNLKLKEGRNNDDDNDTDILNEAIEVPNDNDYHEPRPQHPNSAINHPPRSQITKASQSFAFCNFYI